MADAPNACEEADETEPGLAQGSDACPILSGDDENQDVCQGHQGLAIRIGEPGISDEGGGGLLTTPPDDDAHPPDGGREIQGCRGAQVPPSRVRKLSARDDTVASKRRKYTRKRTLDQQHDGGQKKICFRSGQQLGVGVNPSQQIPALQHQVTAPLHSTGQEDPITQHVNPVPLHAELGQNPPLTTGLPGLAGVLQGVARGARATPPEPCGGAGGLAL